MKRRELIVLLVAGAVAYPPLTARSQQKPMPVIGFLGAALPGPLAAYLAAFHEGLGAAGFVEGKNVAIEYRWAEDRLDRLPGLAAELVGRNVDVIATSGGLGSARAAQQATRRIPIVFLAVSDPVEAGLVASLARPGGNLTGLSIMTLELTPKRLELLAELVPQAEVIALLVNPKGLDVERLTREAQDAARAIGLRLAIVEAGAEREFEAAFAALAQRRARALVIGGSAFFNSHLKQLAALALQHAMPAIQEWPEFALAGGLVSYGPSLGSTYRQAGVLVGRILKGAKPADLPVEQPTKLNLVINLKTAGALGLAVPPAILARADQAIE